MAKGVDLGSIAGSGPGGRIVKADIDSAGAGARPAAAPAAPAESPVKPAPAAPSPAPTSQTPHETIKLSNMRKVIARRLTEAKQSATQIYLTVDCNLVALRAKKRRGEKASIKTVK